MYKIIGADGKEYGPISAEVLRQWIAEGRANAQSKVLPEGATEWKMLGELPEFAAPPTPGAPAPLTAIPTSAPAALDQVNGPAIGLMITAIIGFLAQVASIVIKVVRAPMMPPQQNLPQWATALSGTLGVVLSIIALLLSFLVLAGALNMKKLSNYPLVLTASIVAMLPCVGPCCIIGLPIGIWALVVLSKPEVKSAFH